MKKRTLQILTIGLLMAVLFGCDGVSKNEYETLKAENEKLKQEIEDLKFGPDKLLSQVVFQSVCLGWQIFIEVLHFKITLFYSIIWITKTISRIVK